MEPAEQAHLFEEYTDLFGKQKSFTESLLDIIPVAYTTGVLVSVAHRVLLLFVDDIANSWVGRGTVRVLSEQPTQ